MWTYCAQIGFSVTCGISVRYVTVMAVAVRPISSLSSFSLPQTIDVTASSKEKGPFPLFKAREREGIFIMRNMIKDYLWADTCSDIGPHTA